VATIYLIKYYCVFHYFPLTEGLEVNQILKIERPYFGFLLIIGIVFCAELIVKSNTIQKLIYLTIALIFTGFMFFISARNAILTLSLLIIIYFMFFLHLSFLKKIFLSIGVLIAIGLIAANSSNFKTRIFYNKNPSEIIKNNLENEPRIIIWPSVFDATNSINFNCFVGFSNIKTANDSLTNSCVQRLYNNPGRAEWFKSIRYNSHNQFLSYYLIGGICGFSLIAIFFTTLFINHYKHFFEFAIIFAIFCFFVFENVLERQFGCQLTAILLSIIVFKK
jgi:O-antigen ligase